MGNGAKEIEVLGDGNAANGNPRQTEPPVVKRKCMEVDKGQNFTMVTHFLDGRDPQQMGCQLTGAEQHEMQLKDPTRNHEHQDAGTGAGQCHHNMPTAMGAPPPQEPRGAADQLNNAGPGLHQGAWVLLMNPGQAREGPKRAQQNLEDHQQQDRRQGPTSATGDS